MKKYLALLVACMMLFALPAWAGDGTGEAGSGLKKDVVILFTSDVHCGVDRNFGYTGLKAARDQYEAAGNYTLLIDDGDSIQGEPIGTVTKGLANIDLMNDVGYDIAIPGNHDFDYGMDRFLFLTKTEAKFPYISCNFNKEGELVFPPYIVKEFDGVKIGFVGVTTPKTIVTSTPKYFQDADGNFIYGFMQQDTSGKAVYDAVQKAVDTCRKEEGCAYVFVMAHLGNEVESEPWAYYNLIENTNGIDALFDGHSHDSDLVVKKNKDGEDVIRLACGTKMNGIGYLKIPADGSPFDYGLHTYNSEVEAAELLGIKNAMTEVLQEAFRKLDDTLRKVVARSDVELTIYDPSELDERGNPVRIVRKRETNAGDLCVDALRNQGEADIALLNSGAVRASIPAGEITYGDILMVNPFGNMICVIEATGQQILDALEWGAHGLPDELGGFLQVSGLTYEIHSYIDSSCVADENGLFARVDGEYRVKNVMVGGEPLDPEKKYSLASYEYMLLNNGDGFTMFDGAPLLKDRIKLDNQALIDYIVDTLGGVIKEPYENPYGSGRIIVLESAPAEAAENTAESTAVNTAGNTAGSTAASTAVSTAESTAESTTNSNEESISENEAA